MKSIICFLSLWVYVSGVCAQPGNYAPIPKIIPAAERMEVYLPLLKGKNVGVFANHTSLVGHTHLVDTLLSSGIRVTKVFGPEHGFRGTAGAGEKVKSDKDNVRGLTVISLYGNKKKPSADDLKGLDVLLFDLQDVGVRFYTYISSLQYFMEAAFEQGIPLMVLDRPNPNGHYIDGPVLEKSFVSFVGLQPVPVVYGMTIGEYAMMIAGERWLTPQANKKFDYYRNAKSTPDTPFHFLVIKCVNYDRNIEYTLPVAPSPNLPDQATIRMYPSTCFFEGTVMSEGRGTDKPFLYVGHPTLPKNMFTFTPKPNAGAKSSKCYYQTCYGWNFTPTAQRKKFDRIRIDYLINAYHAFPGKDTFFLKNNFFNKLAGNSTLMEQIRKGTTEKEIRESWQPGIDRFKAIRKNYLLYPDFESYR